MRHGARPERRGLDAGLAPGEVIGAVGVDEVASSITGMSTLSRVDYVDHFAIGHASEREATPQEWARMMFGATPDLIERLLWSGVLGLRLREGRSPDTVAGWSVNGRGEDWIRIAATGSACAGELVVRATGTTLGLTTLMRYDRSRARLIWRPTSAVHRRLAPTLLRQTLATAAKG